MNRRPSSADFSPPVFRPCRHQSRNYSAISGIAGSSFAAGASGFDYGGAAGGFLLYPNKPNTNQMQSVYAK